jgi:hypothetical protein
MLLRASYVRRRFDSHFLLSKTMSDRFRHEDSINMCFERISDYFS